MFAKPPKFHFQTTRLLLLGLFLCIFTAGSALAAPPADKPCKGSKCPPPPPVPQGEPNNVFWGIGLYTSDFYDYEHRTCDLTMIAADASSGTYSCALNSNLVKYDMQEMPGVPIHGEDGDDYYCTRSEYFFAVPNIEYSYSWAGDCTSPEGCDITIVNQMAMGTQLYGNMYIEAFVNGVQTSDPNPFVEAQDLTVDYLHVTLFTPKKKPKLLAICERTPAPGKVTFHTLPDSVVSQ